MTGITITKIESKTTIYCVKNQETKKTLGYLKHNPSEGAFVFCADYEAVLTSNQLSETINHLNEINKK